MTFRVDKKDKRYVLVDVRTQASSVMAWREAALLDPRTMDWAHVVAVSRLEAAGGGEYDDDIVATLRMSAGLYDYFLTGMDENAEFVPSAIEASLDVDAWEILEEAEIAETVREIPVLSASDGIQGHVVLWSVHKAASIKEAMDEWPAAYEGVTMFRLSSGEGGKVWLALTVTADILGAAETEMEFKPIALSDALYAALERISMAEWENVRPPSGEYSRSSYRIEDDEIPF